MRHLKAGKRLGVTTSHRKAVMRNLVTSLLENGEIKTTITRAKEMRKYLDKMIGFGKKGTLHSRRQVLAFIKSDGAVEKLFNEYGRLYQDRMGGYTRIYRLGNRLGDNAQMAIIQMVGVDTTEQKAKVGKDEAIEEIKEELVEEIETKSEGRLADEKDAASEKKHKLSQAQADEVESKPGDEDVAEVVDESVERQLDEPDSAVITGEKRPENDQAVTEADPQLLKNRPTEVKKD